LPNADKLNSLAVAIDGTQQAAEEEEEELVPVQ